ncbi:MAG: DUF1772 domain-containing protein [Pseudomonadota bacterium]
MIDILNTLSTAMLGLLAGALLTEGMILVPYWRKMDPAEFFRLHGDMGPSLFRYFAPLTTAAVLFAVLAAIMTLTSPTLSYARLIAGGGAMLTLMIFFIYFKTANQSFADQSLSHDALKPELTRWATWHWIRTAIIFTAFACAVVAESSPDLS